MARPLSRAEALAATLTAFLAIAILWSWTLDLVGLAFTPWRVLALSLPSTGAIAWRLFRQAHTDRAATAGYLAIVVTALAWLLWLAWPSLLPIGGGDLTHHLQLVDYLERHWRLVHDPSVEAYLGEMIHYTPGVHLLAALSGRWLGSDGLHMTHPVVAFSLALKAGFVYLIARRLLASAPSRDWLALVAPVLLLIPNAYVLDGFLKDSFLAQVMSEAFAVAMWWALTAWHDEPAPATLARPTRDKTRPRRSSTAARASRKSARRTSSHASRALAASRSSSAWCRSASRAARPIRRACSRAPRAT